MVVVTLTPDGERMARDIGVSIPALIEQAETRIDELYKVTRVSELLRAFGEAAAFSQRGLGVSYAVDAGDIMFGATVAGVHGDVAIGTTNSLLGGSFANFAGMAGVNLARWRRPRWTVFGSGFYQSTTIHGLSGHLLTAGAHVQYQILPPTRPAHARWTGLAATAGVEYARWSIGTVGSIESHFTAAGPMKHYTMHMSSLGTLDVLSSTTSFPVELTTGVRLLNVLGFYAGAGLSLTTGNSTIVTELESALTITSQHIPVGTAFITADGENTPSTAAAHALGGVEIHTAHVRVFAQGVIAPGEFNVALGLRVVP